MHFPKNKADLTVMEAVDNLSQMAEIDLTRFEEPEKPSADGQLSEQLDTFSWHDPQYYVYHRERIKETFHALHRYMKELYEKNKEQLKDEETQRGIQAMMVLVSEAAQKVDRHTDIFKGEPESVTELREYKELQHFYLNKIVQKFQKAVEFEVPWQEGWGAGFEEDKIGIQKGGLQTLGAIHRDKEYELFSIRKEDGHPFFNRSLLHHIQLIGQFDFMLRDVTRENPFLRIPIIQDRDAHLAAKEILHLASSYMEQFFKEALKFKQMGFVSAISKAVMALMLAANPRNLKQTAIGKCALHYYTDFHNYLRSGLQSQEYHRFLKNPPQLSERFLHALVNLSHVLAASFFLRTIHRQDIIAFIHLLIEKGSKGDGAQSQTPTSSSLWNGILSQDDRIRRTLKTTLNGPLMMALRLFSEDKQLRGFDPLAQRNFPGLLYTMVGDDLHVSCLRLPTPTAQISIDKAAIADEFYGFLRFISSPKRAQRHLLINLQDRTSWYERARCNALEAMTKNEEFTSALTVVTLPKNVDFYLQSGSYFDQDRAKEFKREFQEQIASAEQCGFFFPSELNRKALLKFTEEALDLIHRVFFDNKDTLAHRSRLDFIEVFYVLLTLKLIEMIKPDTLSFTCKDGVDTGAAASAELFAFLRLMNGSSAWSKEEKDSLLWLLYSSALIVRERAIDHDRLDRLMSALSLVSTELEARHRETVSSLAKLYQAPFFKGLTLKESE